MQPRIVGHFIALGGGNEIGRSMYLIIFPELKIIFVIDCGIGTRPRSKGKDTTTLPEKLEEFVQKIDQVFKGYSIYVFFSHGHSDHIGAAGKLYILFKQYGIPATFFLTEPTHGLIEVMGKDGIKIREGNELPLHYTRKDLKEFLEAKAITIVRSSDWITLVNGCRVRFEPAGHIRGAASISLQTPYGIFLISGDLGFYDTTTVRGASPKFPDKIRWLAMESTNGDLVLPNPEDEFQKMFKDARETTRNLGHVLVPGYSLGRGPDVGIRLGRELSKEWLQVYMGGLMRPTTRCCFHTHWESDIPFAGEENQQFGFHLQKENIRWINRGENSQGENRLVAALEKKPGIFVVPHGMIQGGLSLALFRAIASDPKNLIMFPGYQAEETNGRMLFKLKKGDDFEVNFPGGEKKIVKVLARVEKYQISGHADGIQLANWVQNMIPHDERSLDLAILVHGDRKGQYYLSEKLRALPNRPKKVLVGVNNKPIPLYI